MSRASFKHDPVRRAREVMGMHDEQLLIKWQAVTNRRKFWVHKALTATNTQNRHQWGQHAYSAVRTERILWTEIQRRMA